MSVTWDDIVKLYQDLPERTEPHPARIYVGELAWERFKAVGTPAGWGVRFGLGLDQMLGLPVNIDGAMPALGWRVVDRDGNVIREGLLSP